MTGTQIAREIWGRYVDWRERLPERYRISPVLMIAALGAGLFGWSAALGALGQTSSELTARTAALRSQYERAATEAPESEWRERLTRVSDVGERLRADLVWSGPSLGVVSARLQSELAGMVQAAGLPGVRVQVAREPGRRGGVAYLEVTIAAGFDLEGARQAVAAIEQASPALEIVAVELSSAQPRRVQITLHAPVDVDA